MEEKSKILIADDNYDGSLVTKGILESYGFEVTGIAKSGEMAIQMVKEHQPDVLLLDMCMPRGDGIGVLKALSSM